MTSKRDTWRALDKKRWIILVISCLINLCIGSLYAWSVFSAPMADHLSAVTGREFTAADLAIVFTVANSVGPVTLISGGFINDRLGPRWVVFAGGVLFGAGMIGSGFASGTAGLILCYGLGCGLGMGLVYGCTISNSVKFFPDRRGLIGGIATASYGISSVVIPPVANMIIQRAGVQQAFRVIGIAFLVIICAGAFFIEQCPDGYMPAGYEGQRRTGETVQRTERNWKQMLADPVFYVMILLLTSGAVFGLMLISQVSPIARGMIGLSVTAATVSVSILALFNAAGRVAAGYLSDRIGRISTLRIMLCAAIGALFLLYTAGTGDGVSFYIGIAVIGLCFGAFMGVFPGFTADQFGVRNNSVNYGIMFIGFALAGYVGPTLMSSLYGKYGSYQPAFAAAAGLAFGGIVLTVVYRVIIRKRDAEGDGKRNLNE